MKKIILTILIIIIPIRIFSYDVTNTIKKNVKTWDYQDTVLQSAFIFFTTIDWLQSRSMIEQGFIEGNPIFGKDKPSKLQFDLMIPAGMIIHTGISILLPKRYRTPWQCIFIGIESHATALNHRIGVKINF